MRISLTATGGENLEIGDGVGDGVAGVGFPVRNDLISQALAQKLKQLGLATDHSDSFDSYSHSSFLAPRSRFQLPLQCRTRALPCRQVERTKETDAW